MTPLRVQALLEPEDSSSSDFVELPEESSPEVSEEASRVELPVAELERRRRPSL